MQTRNFNRYIPLLAVLCCVITLSCTRNTHIPEPEPLNETSLQLQVLDKEIRLARSAAGNKQVAFPSQDPGVPIYTRTEPSLNQFFVADGWLVMPFYRDPACIRPDFNLLQYFDVPAAFGCPLLVAGFYIIEKDAPLGTFPIIAQSSGDAVPFLFVRWESFQGLAADGVVTMPELNALQPLAAVADRFTETLRPRQENHLVQINASGKLDDGRSFSFHVTHAGNKTRSIGLTID